jgi:hypothetical protein
MANSNSWKKIFKDYKILDNDFNLKPFIISADMIKKSVQDFKNTTEKEVRILCKIDSREDLPEIMKSNNLFILPIKNGEYAILKGDGFVDIPEITTPPIEYTPKISFELVSSKIGDSEMQHLDYSFAISLIRTFCEDETLLLTIRGRKYTPMFSFHVNNLNLEVKSVQTEIDAGYEGEENIVLIEAKNSDTRNINIRQLYYPFRQWEINTEKKVKLLFFEKRNDYYNFWEYSFENPLNFNSIKLIKSQRYTISPRISSKFTI